jgi:hypothetical protein
MELLNARPVISVRRDTCHYPAKACGVSLCQEVFVMRKFWLTAMGFVLAVGMFALGMITQAGANQVTIEPGWRFHEGHWNYYDPGDRAWYYTDGRNWYTYGDNAWRTYNFDKDFGRKSFYREGYVIPKPGADIVVPRHKVYVPR